MNFQYRLKKLLISRPIVLIGAGQLGLMTLKMWPQDLQRPVIFLDYAKTGMIEGIPIQSMANHVFNPNFLYVLSFFKERPNVINQIFEEANQELITVYDIFEIFLPDKFGNGWYANIVDYLQLKQTKSYYSDFRSKQVIESAAQWKFRRRLLESLKIADEATKYNFDFINPEHKTYDFVIDGGCHNFYLLEKIRSSGISFKKYLAVEPDPNSPVNRTGSLLEELPRGVKIIRKGLVGNSLQRELLWSGLLSARLVPNPPNIKSDIELVRLSDLIKEYGIDLNHRILIKLHIEGLEFDVIREFLPSITGWKHIHFMINLSHNKESLIQVPRLLSKQGYTLKLESHSLFGEGITLYAKM